MHTRTSRTLTRVMVVAVLLAVGASVWQFWTAWNPGITHTASGPLTPADRDLLEKVRLAGLWEMPTGQQMQQQAIMPAVKVVGSKITAEHMELDQKVRDAAGKVDVALPASPSTQQVAWMKEISSKTGVEYDRTAVQRLRQAHGTVLPVVMQVRVDTRNEVVRGLALEAQAYVTRHIGYLESTGLVDYSALPPTPAPGLLSGSASWHSFVAPGLVTTAVLLVAANIGTALRRRARPRAVPPARDLLHSYRRAVGGTGSARSRPHDPVER